MSELWLSPAASYTFSSKSPLYEQIQLKPTEVEKTNADVEKHDALSDDTVSHKSYHSVIGADSDEFTRAMEELWRVCGSVHILL